MGRALEWESGDLGLNPESALVWPLLDFLICKMGQHEQWSDSNSLLFFQQALLSNRIADAVASTQLFPPQLLAMALAPTPHLHVDVRP